MGPDIDFLDGRVLTRAAAISAFDEETGIVEGRAAPYDISCEIAPGLFESFAPGTFRGAVKDPARVKVRAQNHGAEVVGHAVEIFDNPDGVHVRLKVVDTVAGNDVLKLLRAGSLDQLSVEFRAIPKGGFSVERRTDGIHVRHKRAHLVGVSPVPEGAYGEAAKILSVRDMREKELESALAWFSIYRNSDPFRVS